MSPALRLRPSHIVVPVVVLLVVTALLTLHAAAEASCNVPDHQLEAGELTKAEAGYTAILAREPGNECAARGREKADAETCARARQAMRAGRLNVALNSFTGLLDRRPYADCAAIGRVDLRDTLCGRARILKAGGAQTQAANLYRKILEADLPGSIRPCPLEGVKDEEKTLIEPKPNGSQPSVVVIHGADGRRGPSGRRGPPGRDGSPGRNGKNGNNGKNGRDGRDGRDGEEAPFRG